MISHMKKILVTGGTGYIGSHTVVELQNSGYEVVIVDNLSNSRADVVDNIAEVSGVKPAFEEVDCVDKEAMRKVFEKELTKEGLNTYYEELGTTLGEALIAPTKIYVKALAQVKKAGVRVKACSHITGGGFYENVPRMLKDGVQAVIQKDSYPVLPIFRLLAEKGQIEEKIMYNTFNMGLGMIVAVDPADVEKTMEAMRAAGETPYVVGSIESGEKGVVLC